MQKSKIKSQNYNWIVILYFAFCILNFMGCATVPSASFPLPPPGIPGIYHRIERGQTMWRISKTYNVDLDELVKINRISDATSIEVGQLIFIPHRQKQQDITQKFSTEEFVWPLKGKVIAAFGQTFNNMINKGINIQPYGIPDVFASRSGRVVFYADDFKNFGKTIIIDHGDGLLTVYARNSQVFIRAGDSVQRGTLIAKAGSGSDRDKNVYLHFQIRKGHIPQNPYFYLPHR